MARPLCDFLSSLSFCPTPELCAAEADDLLYVREGAASPSVSFVRGYVVRIPLGGGDVKRNHNKKRAVLLYLPFSLFVPTPVTLYSHMTDSL